ncbi:hypothetical protein HYW11_03310 [Candidatus Peregrinibacteria bacterium]|nr:hypothetical protein [Candidatus Peregrinibacteria bacterium]
MPEVVSAIKESSEKPQARIVDMGNADEAILREQLAPVLSRKVFTVDGISMAYQWRKQMLNGQTVKTDQEQKALAAFPDEATFLRFEQFIVTFNAKLAELDPANEHCPIAAGNTAGIQQAIAGQQDTNGRTVFYGLPKGAEPGSASECVKNSSATTLVYPAPSESASGGIPWGAEVNKDHKYSILSHELGVDAVLLVSGGDFVKKQIPDYVHNVLLARKAGKQYRILAVNNVGGASDRSILEPAVRQYFEQHQADVDMSALLAELNGAKCTWIRFVNSGDEAAQLIVGNSPREKLSKVLEVD